MALFVLQAFALPARADNEVTNNSCPGEHYVSDGTGLTYGSLSAADTQDWYYQDVSANDMISLYMNDGYAPGTQNFDFALYGPGCSFIESWPGGYASYVAPTAGRYSVRVYVVSGAGGYDLGFDARPQTTKSCWDDTASVASDTLGWNLSCSVGSPVCGGSTCWYEMRVEVASGVGPVAAQFGPASCTGATGSCASLWVAVDRPTFAESCSTTLLTLSYHPRLICSIRFYSP